MVNTRTPQFRPPFSFFFFLVGSDCLAPSIPDNAKPSSPVPLLDLLNTTFLLPKTTTFSASGINRGQGSAFSSLLPNHIIKGRFEFSKQVCGQLLPIVFQPEGWMVNTMQLGSVLQRYAPAENVVYLGPAGAEEPRAQIVHPSLYSGPYFTAQGINAVLFQSPV
ncbi:unnamed protein product [Closterium sp. NIES-64]|nr:unnamed protein product [Closterium sp. NIES-64]